VASDALEIHLLRHAHAGDPAKWTGPDTQRPLSAKGRKQAQRLGALLEEQGIEPDAIVSSPRIRAQETAELVAEALGMTVTLDDRLAGPLDLATIEAIAADARAGSLMLVGHDPDFTQLLRELVGGDGLEMKKGTLATIDAPRPLRASEGTLRWLVPPSLLNDH
jgi:phosphohistidine phosphatase